MVRRLSELEVHQIKLLICEGFSQTDAARALDVSQAIVSKICMGDVHRDIPWPNPDVGISLMRDRGKRGERNMAQAMLASGTPSLPSYERVEQSEVSSPPPGIIQMSEEEAIAQARSSIMTKEERHKLILERFEDIEREDEEKFLEAMSRVGPSSNKDIKPTPSLWKASFIPWKKIPKDNSIAKALDETYKDDKIVQRAIGIVFYTLPKEEWEDQQTVIKISVVVNKLKEGK